MYLYKNNGNSYTGGYGTGNNQYMTPLQVAYKDIDEYKATLVNRNDYNESMFEKINSICIDNGFDEGIKNHIMTLYEITPLETISMGW